MKVLFFSYPSAFQNIGGGEILLLKMKEYVGRAGVEVKPFDMWHDHVEKYDLLHVFGSVKDCLGLVRVARSRKVKIAITPLFWSSWRRALFTYGGALEKAELVARHAAKVFMPFLPSSRKQLMLESDLVFPNSEMEKEQIHRFFGVPREKMTVVYNGVDRRFEKSDPALFRSKYGQEPFILGVGRLEPRKNQLTLIRAAKKLGKRLILIGSHVSGFESYRDACRREGAGFTTFVDTLAHEDRFLASAYAAAELFVLQGWFETPGLVALEAILAGARVAVTSGGSTREYFQGDAEYFDPASADDMAAAVTRALARPRSHALKERVLEKFTWDSIARETVEAYKKIP